VERPPSYRNRDEMEAASFPGKRAAAPFRPLSPCCPVTSAKLFIGFNQEYLWTGKDVLPTDCGHSSGGVSATQARAQSWVER
jgi:hypothetical protein